MKSQLGFRRLLASAAVLAVTVVSQLSHAQVVGGIRPMPGPSHPGYPGYNDRVVTVSVNQSYNGFSSIDVDGLFGYASQGRAIQSISVRMAAQGGRSQVTLLVNGVPQGRGVVVGQYLQEYAFDSSRTYPGANLELRMNGPVYIQAITATFVDNNPYPRPPYPQPPYPQPPYPQPPYPQPPYPQPPYPQPPYPQPPHPRQDVLSQYINGVFTGTTNLSMNQILGLDRYYGRRVNRVILRARADGSDGRAVLIVNGRRDGMSNTLSPYTQDMSFYPAGNGRVGAEIRDLSIQLIGRVVVESVSVELAPY